MIKRPIVSEKSMNLTKLGFYSFLVDKNMSKEKVKKEAEDKFKVDVMEVRIVNVPGKTKLQRTRKGYFQTQGKKKAIVKLKKGQKIPLFENLGEKDEEVTVKTAEGEEVAKVKEKKSLLRGTKVRIEKGTGDSEQGAGKKKKKGESIS